MSSSSNSFPMAAVVPAVFDVAEEFDADFVGVEVARGHVDGAEVVVGVVDDFRRSRGSGGSSWWSASGWPTPRS